MIELISPIELFSKWLDITRRIPLIHKFCYSIICNYPFWDDDIIDFPVSNRVCHLKLVLSKINDNAYLGHCLYLKSYGDYFLADERERSSDKVEGRKDLTDLWTKFKSECFNEKYLEQYGQYLHQKFAQEYWAKFWGEVYYLNNQRPLE